MRTQRRKGLHRPPPASTLSSPLYERILQFRALSCLRQQGTDVRMFAQQFSDAAEGLGFNHAALKDMFNSVLDEPLNWWRMRGLDHLTFVGFIDFLARQVNPPAEEAAAPPVVAEYAAAPPAAFEEAAAPPAALDEAAAPPVVADDFAAPPVVVDGAVTSRSRRRRRRRRKASSTLQGLEAIPEPSAGQEAVPELLQLLALSAKPMLLALPAPPMRLSLPAPPMRLSLPAPPKRLALPAPPRLPVLPGPPWQPAKLLATPWPPDGLEPAWSVPPAPPWPSSRDLVRPEPPWFVPPVPPWLSSRVPVRLDPPWFVPPWPSSRVPVWPDPPWSVPPAPPWLRLRSSVIHGFVTEPWCSHHVRVFMWARSFECARVARSLVCVHSFVWSVVFGSRHSCLEFRFVSGFRHSRSIFCHCVCAVSGSLDTAHSCPRVFCCVARSSCFYRLRAFMLYLVLCGTQLVYSLAACFHVVMSCVNTWLMSFLISCVFMSCFAHGWWFVCWPCACVSVLCEYVASVLVFCVPCALMSICLDPTHLVTGLFINFPQLLSLVTLLICSLYNLLVFAVPCGFVT